MDGTLVFLHGTGARDISVAMADIREGARRWLDLPPAQVHGVEWGRAVGPDDLDVTPALPQDVATKALAGEISDAEVALAVWDLLTTDPSLELRILTETTPPSESAFIVGGEPPAIRLQRRLLELSVGDEALGAAGVSASELRAAALAVHDDPYLVQAATAQGDEGQTEVANAAARSVVGRLIARPAIEGRKTPTITLNGTARDAFVDAVTGALSPVGTRGWLSSTVGKILGPLVARAATRVAIGRREGLTNPATDFVRDVAYYFRRGEDVRSYIANEVKDLPQPVVLLCHSLGGIAAVDLLARVPGRAPVLPGVKLLVTVGSQAPLFFLMDALHELRPRSSETDLTAVPFEPWLNLYNRSDLISFCASRVFPNQVGIVDEEVDAGVPFPASHSAYWTIDRVFQLVKEHWPAD